MSTGERTERPALVSKERMPPMPDGNRDMMAYAPSIRRAHWLLFEYVWSDPAALDLKELIRFRSVRYSDCYLCRNNRFTVDGERIMDESIYGQAALDIDKADLSDRHKVILRWTDAFCLDPAGVTNELRAEMAEHFDQQTILACVSYNVIAYCVGKIRISMGMSANIGDDVSELRDTDIEPVLNPIEYVVNSGKDGVARVGWGAIPPTVAESV